MCLCLCTAAEGALSTLLCSSQNVFMWMLMTTYKGLSASERPCIFHPLCSDYSGCWIALEGNRACNCAALGSRVVPYYQILLQPRQFFAH